MAKNLIFYTNTIIHVAGVGNNSKFDDIWATLSSFVPGKVAILMEFSTLIGADWREVDQCVGQLAVTAATHGNS